MGTFCTACNKMIDSEGRHMPTKCPHCGNTDRTKFVRVDVKDMDPKILEQYKKDKKYLESRREKK